MAAPSGSEKFLALREKLINFCEENIVSGNKIFYEHLDSLHPSERFTEKGIHPILDEIKEKAKKAGLWNLFLHKEYKEGAGLTNYEYGQLAEIMGRYSGIGSECFNCSAPDTGNMETLVKYGTDEQKQKWLVPLLEGKIRSVFLMTEPDVASSDATNISTKIVRDGNEYIINGSKWWSSGAPNPYCKIGILMGKIEGSSSGSSKHSQQSMILVPMDTKGIKMKRVLQVFGYDDAPEGHGEVIFENVRVPVENILLGEGRGFEIAQGRLGPGRIHHCMRAIGMAEYAQELLIKRAMSRSTFGKKIIQHQAVAFQIAENRIAIDQARLLVLNAASMIDKHGDARYARREIAMIKIAVPRMACHVVDSAIQVHGGAGVSQDFHLARLYAGLRTLRFADGPDEVHLQTLAMLEIKEGGRLLKSKI